MDRRLTGGSTASRSDAAAHGRWVCPSATFPGKHHISCPPQLLRRRFDATIAAAFCAGVACPPNSNTAL